MHATASNPRVCVCVFSTLKTNSTDDNITNNPQLSYYQLVYGVLGVVMVLLAAIDCFTYTWVILNAAGRLHNSLFKKVRWDGGVAAPGSPAEFSRAWNCQQRSEPLHRSFPCP